VSNGTWEFLNLAFGSNAPSGIMTDEKFWKGEKTMGKMTLFGYGIVEIGVALIVVVVASAILTGAGLIPTEYNLLALAGVGGDPTVGETSVSVSGEGILQQVTTVNIESAVTESVADTTGVKNKIGGSLAYYYDGIPNAFETTTLSTTAYASSTTDPKPGDKIIGIMTNSSYYHAKLANPDGSALEVPLAQNMQITGEADLLNTVTVYCQNTTSGTWATTGMNQTLGSDEAVTLDCKIKGGVARGVFKAPIVVGFNYNSTNWSAGSTYVVGSTRTEVPSGTMSGYETAWLSTIPSVEDFNTEYFQVRLTPASGVNPTAEIITLEFNDCGATFTKNVWPVLFTGCQNADTSAAIGSTDANFAIYLD